MTGLQSISAIFRVILDKRADPQQDVLEGCNVARLRPAITLQEWKAA